MYLNRSLIHYQVNQSKSKESCVIMEKVVSYVSDIFKLVNELIIKLDYPEHVLSKLAQTYFKMNKLKKFSKIFSSH